MAVSNDGEQMMSTGEAARMLGVSRSTVSRRFDRGDLQGSAHPITGERMISRDSVIDLMQGARASVANGPEREARRQILLVTSSAALHRRIGAIASATAHLKLTSISSGSDALIECAGRTPDLLIVTDDLLDISCPRVVEALRRSDTGKRLKILCCCDDPAIRECNGNLAGNLARMSNEEILRSINTLLGIDVRPREIPGAGRRRWKRQSVSVPARIGFYRNREPRKAYWGQAVVENISRGGAFLNAIRMDGGVIPAEPFRLLLQVGQPPLMGLRATCQVIRLGSNGAVSAGVRFLRVSATGRNTLAELGA